MSLAHNLVEGLHFPDWIKIVGIKTAQRIINIECTGVPDSDEPLVGIEACMYIRCNRIVGDEYSAVVYNSKGSICRVACMHIKGLADNMSESLPKVLQKNNSDYIRQALRDNVRTMYVDVARQAGFVSDTQQGPYSVRHPRDPVRSAFGIDFEINRNVLIISVWPKTLDIPINEPDIELQMLEFMYKRIASNNIRHIVSELSDQQLFEISKPYHIPEIAEFLSMSENVRKPEEKENGCSKEEHQNKENTACNM